MLIDSTNSMQGNKAVASVLLLYYHLLLEGGITNDQTVYLDHNDFDAFELIRVEVSADQRNEFDQEFLRRGAVVALLCDLDDMVTDYEDDYLSQPFTKKILDALNVEATAAVPEVKAIVKLVTQGEAQLDYVTFKKALQGVFKKYVVQKFKAIANGDCP